MADALKLFNPLSEFNDFNPREAADRFKATAYECSGNPSPTETNLAAFTKYAKQMEIESK